MFWFIQLQYSDSMKVLCWSKEYDLRDSDVHVYKMKYTNFKSCTLKQDTVSSLVFFKLLSGIYAI